MTPAVALIAFVIGTVSGWLWTRWRHQVVRELRRIRELLENEQEPTLRAIRDHLARLSDAEKGDPPGRAALPSLPRVDEIELVGEDDDGNGRPPPQP